MYAWVKEKRVNQKYPRVKNRKSPKRINIKDFKIYPSPFTSSPNTASKSSLSKIFSYPSEIFCYLSEIISYLSEIFFRKIPWIFPHFISRIHANRTNRIGRKRKCCIFATSIRSNAGFLKKNRHKNLEVRIIQRNFADENHKQKQYANK